MDPADYNLHFVSLVEGQNLPLDVLIFAGIVTDTLQLRNGVVCHLPHAWAETPQSLPAEKAGRMLNVMASCWEADWGAISHEGIVPEIAHTLRAPVLGLVTYLAPWRSPIPPLPDYARVEKLEDGAHIVALDDVFLSRSTDEYVARSCEVHDILDRAGVLLPTPLWPDDDPIAFAERVRKHEEACARRDAETI